jgi:hypothetical protein
VIPLPARQVQGTNISRECGDAGYPLAGPMSGQGAGATPPGHTQVVSWTLDPSLIELVEAIIGAPVRSLGRPRDGWNAARERRHARDRLSGDALRSGARDPRTSG